MVNINLKQIGLQLCTCTWVEIMTGVGITLYLLLVMHSHLLAVLTMGLFAPLIGFHFIITRISKKEEAREQQEQCSSSECRRKLKYDSHFVR